MNVRRPIIWTAVLLLSFSICRLVYAAEDVAVPLTTQKLHVDTNFSSTAANPVWTLNVQPAPNYRHKHGAAGVNSSRWAIPFPDAVVFKCETVSQPAELRFLGRIFNGVLEPIPKGSGGSGGSTPDLPWDVTGKTDGDYLVIPESTTVCVNASVTFYATDTAGNPAPSSWVMVSRNGTPCPSLPDGASVTVSMSKPDFYTIVGTSLADANLHDAGEMIVLKVAITGFSRSPTWARSTACPATNHQSICTATIQPPGASTVTYSIQGDSNGATIDSSTGVISPATDDSGTIRVRATATLLSTCYAESDLLIRAHPTAIGASAVNPVGTYGGGWTHTFNGTGGTLDGVQISETVQTQLPNPFRWNLNISPGPPNVWTLNAGGTMDAPDFYSTQPDWINATTFLPSPPKAGLPQTGSDRQQYHWQCTLCAKAWRQFMGPHNIDVTLMYNGINLIVRTSAYGQSTDDAYAGPLP